MTFVGSLDREESNCKSVYYLFAGCFQLHREESNSSFLDPIIIILMLAFDGSLLTHIITLFPKTNRINTYMQYNC